MSKIDIIRSCGHVEKVNICGPYRDRDRRAERAAEKSCRECWLRERDAENDRAAAANADDGLPPLTGSPEQIRWAERVRRDLIRELDETLTRDQEKMLAAGCDEMAAEAASIAAEVRNETAAAWWIDNRQTYGAQDAYRDRLRDWARKNPELSQPPREATS